ncbi:MAG: translation initiation factor [Pirellulales bacterium]
MGLFAGTKWDVPSHCDRCEKLESDCTCPPLEAPKLEPGKQTARATLEKRKKGKMVSVIRGLAAKDNDLPALLTKLKNSCGAGGTIDGDELEIQGDHVAKIQKILKEIGYRVGK